MGGRTGRARLTKRVVDAAQPPPGWLRAYLFDSEVPGFALIVRQGKSRVWRTYALRFTAKGLRKWITIGEHGAAWAPGPDGRPRTLTAEVARDQARQYRGAWMAGQDPRAIRAAGRASTDPAARDDCPTLEAFSERYLRDHTDVHKAYTTAKEERGLLRRYILPWKGRARLDDITEGHVAELQAKLKDRPAAANRTIILLRHMLNTAIRWRVLPRRWENPCIGAPRFEEGRRERFLSAEEFRKLGAALAVERERFPLAVAAIMVLALCAARPAEILGLQRAQLSLDQGHAMIRRKGLWRPLFLPPPAVAILEALPSSDAAVFTGLTHAKVYHVWLRAKKTAGIPDIRPYDLRHSVASWAVNAGRSLAVIGKMLGHTNTRTTERYAHLTETTVREAGDAVAAQIAEALKG